MRNMLFMAMTEFNKVNTQIFKCVDYHFIELMLNELSSAS